MWRAVLWQPSATRSRSSPQSAMERHTREYSDPSPLPSVREYRAVVSRTSCTRRPWAAKAARPSRRVSQPEGPSLRITWPSVPTRRSWWWGGPRWVFCHKTPTRPRWFEPRGSRDLGRQANDDGVCSRVPRSLAISPPAERGRASGQWQAVRRRPADQWIPPHRPEVTVRIPEPSIGSLSRAGLTRLSFLVVAVALYGNPRHNANQKFNVGTGSATDGVRRPAHHAARLRPANPSRFSIQVMARPPDNLAALQAWGDRLQDYCANGDIACNAGKDGGAHSSYFSSSYASIPAKWIKSKLGVWVRSSSGYNVSLCNCSGGSVAAGMAKLNGYLYWINAAPTEKCICGQAIETVGYFHFRCTKLDGAPSTDASM